MDPNSGPGFIQKLTDFERWSKFKKLKIGSKLSDEYCKLWSESLHFREFGILQVLDYEMSVEIFKLKIYIYEVVFYGNQKIRNNDPSWWKRFSIFDSNHYKFRNWMFSKLQITKFILNMGIRNSTPTYFLIYIKLRVWLHFGSLTYYRLYF